MGYREYALPAALDDVVTATLVPFGGPDAAGTELSKYADQLADNPSWMQLDAGNTGPDALFALHDHNYKLQFVAGNALADVGYNAPYDAGLLSPACEAAVWQLVEVWYALQPSTTPGAAP